jgi:hypothetical protein
MQAAHSDQYAPLPRAGEGQRDGVSLRHQSVVDLTPDRNKRALWFASDRPWGLCRTIENQIQPHCGEEAEMEEMQQKDNFWMYVGGLIVVVLALVFVFKGMHDKEIPSSAYAETAKQIDRQIEAAKQK